MTEKQAWLKIGRMFNSAGPTWEFHGTYRSVIGICQAITCLDERSLISPQTDADMMDRLGGYFKPNGRDPEFEFFWAENTRRTSRTLRATACCFLAAMCDD